MKRLSIPAALAIGMLLHGGQASAQAWSPQQHDVWGVMQEQWRTAMAMDARWMESFLREDFRGWALAEPFPHDEDSPGRWGCYDPESLSMLIRDLVPIEVLVRGDTAVVHYHYAQPGTDREGRHETLNGPYTETLVFENDRWRLHAWTGEAPADPR
jgi:hypothetical protein